jgi:hypothetical protein
VWWDQPPDGLDIPVIFVEVWRMGCNLKKKREVAVSSIHSSGHRAPRRTLRTHQESVMAAQVWRRLSTPCPTHAIEMNHRRWETV